MILILHRVKMSDACIVNIDAASVASVFDGLKTDRTRKASIRRATNHKTPHILLTMTILN